MLKKLGSRWEAEVVFTELRHASLVVPRCVRGGESILACCEENVSEKRNEAGQVWLVGSRPEQMKTKPTAMRVFYRASEGGDAAPCSSI